MALSNRSSLYWILFSSWWTNRPTRQGACTSYQRFISGQHIHLGGVLHPTIVSHDCRSTASLSIRTPPPFPLSYWQEHDTLMCQLLQRCPPPESMAVPLCQFSPTRNSM